MYREHVYLCIRLILNNMFWSLLFKNVQLTLCAHTLTPRKKLHTAAQG